MRNNKTASLFPKKLVIESLKQSFIKLNPRMMFRNPIMFIVEVVTFVMLFVTIWAVATGDTTQGSFGYNMTRELLADHVVLEVKALLRDANLDIKDIVRQTGFSNQSSLSRFFRRHTGMSPTEYRRTIHIIR